MSVFRQQDKTARIAVVSKMSALRPEMFCLLQLLSLGRPAVNRQRIHLLPGVGVGLPEGITLLSGRAFSSEDGLMCAYGSRQCWCYTN